MKLKKILSGLTSLALSVTAFSGIASRAPETALNASAATANWKFDLGGGGTASGYTGVSATEAYSSSRALDSHLNRQCGERCSRRFGSSQRCSSVQVD